MNVDKKKTVQSGAFVSAVNGILLNVIAAWELTTEWNDVWILLATPTSLIIAWGVLFTVKMLGSVSFEEVIFQRAFKKEMKANRKILKGNGYSEYEKKEAEKAINNATTLHRTHSAKRLKDLSKKSQNSKDSFEHIVTTNQDNN